MSVGPRSFYVRCASWPRCKFTSDRHAETPDQAERKPCPRCNAPVVVIQRPHTVTSTSPFAAAWGTRLSDGGNR
jgi:ssDNA-binding Zn-finger/Zn-ribbon topoisomerase 1